MLKNYNKNINKIKNLVHKYIGGNNMLKYEDLPEWILSLELEDLNFLKKMILFSGSLKDLAKDYDVTYPTIRVRLDKLIEKVKLSEHKTNDIFVEMIKQMAIDDRFSLETAKKIISTYRGVKKNGS